MDEELWLDYYYGRNEKERDEEPDPDSREESKKIKYQEKDELENNVQTKIEPHQDQEKQNQHQEHHERKRWGREHDRRSRITNRTYQRPQQTPSLQRAIKEIPRPLSATDQIIPDGSRGYQKIRKSEPEETIYLHFWEGV